MTATTYRAAYVLSDPNSNGAGIALTTKDQAGLPDDQLMALAKAFADETGVQGEIIIGDWTE